MADYIYLLENRLNAAQRGALRAVREVARSKGLTVFLVGGAVRDLTSGSPVRDLDVVVQGNALKLKKELEKAGAAVTGELEAGQALFLRFAGNVRMEVGSTLSVTFPKPGKPVAKAANILEDLRRRDFTANSMALSLNEGSYGLLMDPLNGVADIENRQLRLVSPYGFIEDPVRMIRAARLMARLGWTLDEKTQARYETGKQEGYIAALSEFHRGYETEEIVHEEDPLRVLSRLEVDGWMKYLAPYWSSAKVNVAELERLREAQAQLQMQGIQPDGAAASFPLLTAKLAPKEIATLKAGFPRQGFVAEIDGLEAEAKEFAGLLGGKAGTLPSQAWRLITSGRPEAVLWAAYSTRSPVLQAKFKSFATEWPAARQKMPYVLMQEMRIVPEVAGYDELLERLFFELMDGKLGTVEEMKAFLEPYSPPAPPPPVNLRRARASKKESKPAKPRAKKAAAESDGEADALDSVHEDGGVEPELVGSAKPEMEEFAEAKTEAKAPAEEVPKLPMRVAPLKFVIPEPEPGAGKGVAAAGKKAASVAARAPAPAAKSSATVASAPVAKGGKQAPVAQKVTGAKAVAVAGGKAAAVKKTAATKQAVPAKKAAAPVAKKAAAKKVPATVPTKSAAKAGAKTAATTPAKAAKVASKKAVATKATAGKKR